MTRKMRPFRELRQERLAGPEVAALHLNATRENSPDHFLEAVRKVVQARYASGASEEPAIESAAPR